MWTTHEDWRGAHPNASVLFRRLQLSGFHFFPDWMHCKHLGVDQYCYAAIICYLADEILEGESKAAKYNWLMACLRTKYKDTF